VTRVATVGAIIYGVAAIAISIRLGTEWVDDLDNTCAALYRPDVWSDRYYCREIMRSRILAIGGLNVGLVMSIVAVVCLQRRGTDMTASVTAESDAARTLSSSRRA
jgi:hypothetical protein